MSGDNPVPDSWHMTVRERFALEMAKAIAHAWTVEGHFPVPEVLADKAVAAADALLERLGGAK